MKWNPHRYMMRAMRFVVERMCAALFLDPGLGKTSITYGSFKTLVKSKMVERMLVIAPLKPAGSTWPREAAKWDDFKGLNVHVLHGKDKQKLLEQPHDVSVINPEGLEWLLGTEKEEVVTDDKGKPIINPKTGGPKVRIVKVPGAAQKAGVWWDMLVVDESTRFKHTKTIRFKTLKRHLHRFPRRVILTGSPAPNGLMDLYGQVYILDMGRSLGPYITHYRNNYFDAVGFGGFEWKPKPDAQKRIEQVLKPLVLRMSAEDYLDMPPLLGVNPPQVVEVELPEESRRVYTQMETLLMAQLEDGFVTAANVGAATMKCRQIANGGLYLDDGKFKNLHDAKTEAVQDLVEELGGKPAMIAYEFKHDLARLQRAFPGAPHLGGGVNSKVQREVEDKWNAGLVPVLLAQPSSVAHGLNLQGVGAAVIFHSLIWNLEEYEQLIRRIWRQGQKERVMVHHVLARGTVDAAVLRGLQGKDRTQRALLAALREEVFQRKPSKARSIRQSPKSPTGRRQKTAGM